MAAPSPSSAPEKPTAEQAKAWLPLYAKSLDTRVARLQKILSTTAGLDSVLCVGFYGFNLIAAQMELVSNLLALSPDVNSVDKQASIAVRRQKIKAAASLCSDVRCFMRLWGLLGMYRWGQSVYYAPPKDAVLRYIAVSQVAVNTVYQAIENAAYLAQHGIISMKAEHQGWAWLMTGRLWMVHTGLDLLRLLRTAAISDGASATQADKEKWWKDLYVSSAYAPLTVHYSLPGGLLTETPAALFGCVAGVLGFRQHWRNTQ